jgi:hypothetical protein
MQVLEDRTPLDLATAARQMPGGPVPLRTVHSWVTRGVRGVKLEATRVGNCWRTSAEALRRFLEALNAGE